MDRNPLELLLIILATVALAACAGAERADDDDDDSGGDADADTDGDADTDADADTDTGQPACVEGQTICVGEEVWECDANGDPGELVETCEDPLICLEGMCVEDSPCGYAMAYRSNVGCEYWAVDMDNTTPEQPYAVVVSNLEAGEDVHVVVEQRTDSGYTVLDEADVPDKSTHVFMLGNNTVSGSYHLPRQAYRVTSDLPVVAYQFNPYAGLQPDNSDICTNDGTLLIPSSGMDRYYYALGYPSNAGTSSMNIVATEDDTTVNVTPSSAIMAGNGVPALAAGVPHTFFMQAADVVQLNTSADISGTYVEADKYVGVFAGSTCAFVPSDVSYCDHVEHQMFPVTTWGTQFVAARSPIRSINQQPENDYWRIMASEDGTTIATNPTVPGIPGTMNAGQVVEVGVNYDFHITASAPILVGQFLTGHEGTDVPFESAGGDPAFALTAPTAQFMTSYVFLAPEKYLSDWLVITHPNGLDVLLDTILTSENPDCITWPFDAEWEITRCLIEDFTHTVDAAEPVGITVWGYGGRVSYGYTGGLDLEVINPVAPE
ncbi:MAG: IgGFc-binding protein [Deltaproteobacteria bacterium]|jgi:hypothetical protein|nr:IgGFc-binding protein [Deltaproteobacteria bacterium]